MAHLKTKLLALIICGSTAVLQPSLAHATGLAVATFPTRVKFAGCAATFDRMMRDMGMTDVNGDNSSRGGTLGPTRAHVVCVPIPNGICGNATGLTLVISAASDNFDNARAVVDRLRSTWGNPILIDCD